MAVTGATNLNEPTNAELKALIERHMAVSDERHRDTIARMSARDVADAEFRGHMKGAMHSLESAQKDTQDRVSKLEKELPGVAKQARSAMQSHDDLHKFVHDTWNEQHEQVVKMLEAQNRDVEERERAREENARRESLAAKALIERREFRVKLLMAGAPILAALIAACSSYAAVRASHSDTDSRLEKIEHAVEKSR